MTQHSDIERLLDHWFKDGPDQAPDRVVDIVTDRIERQSQRPAWRLQRRPFSVNAYAKLAVAAAAVLIVAVVGYNLLPGPVDRRRRARPHGESDGCPDGHAFHSPIAQPRFSGLVHARERQRRSRDPVRRPSDDPVFHPGLHVHRPGRLGQRHR